MRAGVALALALAACGSDKQQAPPAAGPLDVAALIAEGRELAEATWPDARLAGIRVGPEVIFETRREAYAVRLSIELSSDPTDPTARSAAIVCSPTCAIHRAKVDMPTHDWPSCGWTEALAAARKSGLEAAAPVAGYGNWASGPIWQFRERTDDPRVFEVDGVTCAVP